MKKITAILLALLAVTQLHAQGDTGVQEFFKSNLKIYVVAAVLTIILACIFAFLFSLERRLKALEEQKQRLKRH